MCEKNLSSFTAVVGLDWADTKHDVCVQSTESGEREFAVVDHNPEVLDDWVRSLKARYRGPIAVAVELSKGPIISILQKYDFVVIFPINPHTLAKYRETFKPSRAKDDPTDAELAVDLLIRHWHRFKPLKLQSAEIRALSTLVEHRRQLVSEKIRITNRLRSTLKQYYPQILEWFDNIDTPLFCAFFSRWPTLLQARRARASTLKTFFHEHHMYRKAVIERRTAAIKSSVPLTEDEAVIAPYTMHANVLVDQLELVLKAIGSFDAEIQQLSCGHPDYEIFDSLPGAGASLAPRLLVGFGEDRDRFGSASNVQMYAGVAPVTEASGKKHWVHWRWQCSTFLRQTFVEWAAQTINKSYWAGLYYRQQRGKGVTHQAACRSLAFKWIRIVYRCWLTGTLYDESLYLKALERRGSPLLAR
jgi:transposase